MGIPYIRNARKVPLTTLWAHLLFGLVALVLLQPAIGWTHEIGTTQVHFVLGADHRWSASITTAPTMLVNRLEAQAGQPLSSGLAPASVRTQLTRFSQTLADNISVRFDGLDSAVAVSVGHVEMPADATLPAYVVVHADGVVPSGARTVTWRYGLVASTYVVVFSKQSGGSSETQWLDADAQSSPYPVAANSRPPSTSEIAWQYLQLGFLHIVPKGVDHILFVLGIFLLTTSLRSILIQVTAFTIAHSLTLALTIYGVVSLSPRTVEPLIGLSIVYVAIENIATSKLTPWRPAMMFCFGLLHGMGFAGVLAELGLPQSQALPALISFNLGIEVGQLAVIGAAFLAVGVWFRDKPWYRTRIVVPISVVTACIGLFWTVQRLFAP